MFRLSWFLSNTRFQIAAYVLVVVLASAVAVTTASRIALSRAETALREDALQTLQIQSSAIVDQLEKYRHLPALTARRQVFTEIVSAGVSETNRAALHEILHDLTSLSGAIDSALFNVDGSLVLNASDFLEPEMVRRNQLMIAPLEGRLGRASISGSNGRRSYAFSSGVRVDGETRAVLVVAAPLERIEQSWALQANPIFAVNQSGQIVAGNLLAREREAEIRLAMVGHERSAGPQNFEWKNQKDLIFSRYMPLMDWTLHVIQSRLLVEDTVRTNTMVALLSCLLAGFAGLVLLTKMQEVRSKRLSERLDAIRLEKLVRARTRELRDANTALAGEVEERRIAEEALRKTQNELVQSAKLAAIGQMSAALAHEYNQPLAAIRTYAENGQRFISAERHDAAGENFHRITGLVERMAVLSKTLKSFARKPRSALSDIALEPVILDSVLLAGHKAKECGVTIRMEKMKQPLFVTAGPVRLSQVFVNLLSNAIDASVRNGGKEVFIGCALEREMVAISVADQGSGIDEAVREKMFDPFFTTKDVGEGLGLGLAIAYNIIHDFGGTLKASNRPQGGAEFVVRLRMAEAVEKAAQ
ncbi:MAG: ATP-binding protein [Rhizobiaceae bacterium]